MNPPRASTQISLYHKGHLVTRMPNADPANLSELITVRAVDFAIEKARLKQKLEDEK